MWFLNKLDEEGWGRRGCFVFCIVRIEVRFFNINIVGYILGNAGFIV